MERQRSGDRQAGRDVAALSSRRAKTDLKNGVRQLRSSMEKDEGRSELTLYTR